MHKLKARTCQHVDNVSAMTKALFVAAMLLPLSPALAEPVTPARIRTLPETEQASWVAYLERSATNAAADRAALQAEVKARNLTNALRAPSGGDFKMHVAPGAPYYASPEAQTLADAVSSFQSPSGGWSKHTGYSKGRRRPGMQWSSQSEPDKPPHYLATFDNRATTEEMRFLAAVWQATRREDCKDAFVKGLKFILAAQYPNGGWPQVYPLEGDYHDDITFNDGAMPRILELLQAIAQNPRDYEFIAAPLREQAAAALAAGIRCVLKTQVVQDGRPTAWCSQHDALTLQPAAARKMEPATLSGLESADVLGFLMTIQQRQPEVVTAIEGGLAWLDRVKITGLTKANRDGKTTYEPDPASTKIYWARFYDLKTGKPVFPGRDGVVYESFAAMAAHNKLGYDYYSTQPGSILKNGQKKWRKMLASRNAR